MYTIFIKNKPFVLVKNQEDVNLDLGNFFLLHDSQQTLLHSLEAFEKNDVIKKLYVLDSNLDNLWSSFLSSHKLVEAAGGLVKNSKGELLFIFRNSKWDLPKGKIENSESPEDAARREVIEECGIKNLTVIKKLPSTYHTYKQGDERILKKVYWFEMQSDDTLLKPQASEGITDVKWIKNSEVNEVIKNTYQSIQELMTGLSLN